MDWGSIAERAGFANARAAQAHWEVALSSDSLASGADITVQDFILLGEMNRRALP
ncbi:hypothetical protein ANO14919_085540 [Xylariales sp. No.14919]|nr:hypothetical protein ANO14919_085540 [Xylariales sp. No.14919]